MPGTSPPKGLGNATKDPQSAELAALQDAIGVISKRLDTMMNGGNGGGNGDAADDEATGEEQSVVNSGETNEEESGHATEATGGESTSFGGAKRMASDSAARADRQRSRIYEETDEDRIAAMKADLDHAYQSIKGSYSPLAHAGESRRGYLLRCLRPLRHYSDGWKDVDLSKLPDDALAVADRQIRADCIRVGSDPRLMNQFLPAGAGLREVKRRDRSGREISEFYGPISAWLDEFRMPTARVKKFNRHPDRD